MALRCVAGQRWEWDGVRFTMLQPAPEDYAIVQPKPNDLSAWCGWTRPTAARS